MEVGEQGWCGVNVITGVYQAPAMFLLAPLNQLNRSYLSLWKSFSDISNICFTLLRSLLPRKTNKMIRSDIQFNLFLTKGWKIKH